MQDAIKNILAVRNDRLGEFLLSIPALKALKEHSRGAKLTLVINPYLRDLAECLDFIDEIIPWENKKHTLWEIFKLSKNIKNKKFDLCVILNPSKEFNIISFLSGIPMRLGYNRKWGFLLTHKIEDKKHLGDMHEVEYNLELVSLVGAKTNNKTISLEIDSNLVANFKGFIAIHPWTSDPVKEWPVENFCRLTEKIISELGLKVVVIGGKEESNRSSEYFGDLNHERVADLTGKTTLIELAAVLKNCRLLISCDSGPMHLSTAVGTSVIALFRNDLPGKTTKRWGPWGEGNIVIEKNKLSDITVDEVFDKVKERLKI